MPDGDPVYTLDEVKAALVDRDVVEAVEYVLRDPRAKSKPQFLLIEEIMEAAIKAAFG